MEWRIFFIGPTGSAKPSEGSAKRDGYNLHIPKLHAYLIDYLIKRHGYTLTKGNRNNGAALKKGEETIITLIPTDLYKPSDKPTNFFRIIDDSDLIIADLSGNRPSVVYELALSHALGIKTIIIGGPETQVSSVRVFLCHSSGDKPAVRALYKQLKKDGFEPWLDEEVLLPGDDWAYEIAKAVREAEVVLVCLSRSAITKGGFVQKEIKFALDKADEKPEGSLYIIPVLLEECVVPERLSKWQWVSLVDKQGYEKLNYSLQRLKRFDPKPRMADAIYHSDHIVLVKKDWFDFEPRITDVDFQSDHISSVALNREIDNWLRHKNKRFDSINPLTNFYGAPLPDISPATGLAAGFFDNFARPILVGGEIIHRRQDSKQNVSEEARALKGLIVLRPEDLDQRIDQLERNLWAHLISHFPETEVKRGKSNEIFIRTKEGVRIPFFLVRDYMIDIPRTMFSLTLSPRLRSKNDKLRRNMEIVLVNRFFEAVKTFRN
jgi:hypothetical protein